MSIGKVLRDLFTGRDNKTWDLGRVMWAQGCIAYNFMTVYSLYQGLAVDPLQWATGFGAILAAGGAAIMLKAKSEPELSKVTEIEATPPSRVTVTEGEVS